MYTHIHSNYTKETTWESCKLRSCSPLLLCVCFSVRNFHAKSNAILGKSFSKNTKSSSANDPHVIHQRQCLSAKLTIQSRQLRRRLQSQQQQQRRWLRHEVFFFSGAATAFVSRWPTLPAPLCVWVCVCVLYMQLTLTRTLRLACMCIWNACGMKFLAGRARRSQRQRAHSPMLIRWL